MRKERSISRGGGSPVYVSDEQRNIKAKAEVKIGRDARQKHSGMTRGRNEKGQRIKGGDSQQKLLGMTI